MIKVLWVEDDLQYARGFIGLYADDLDITHVDNWKEAQNLLEKDFDAFEAVLLDARCKNKADSIENSKKFMIEAFKSLAMLTERNKHLLPWYVLSGGDKEAIEDLIPEDREKWDGDWSEPYYHKSQDEDALVDNIKTYCNRHNPLNLQIKEVLFKDVFDAIDQLNLHALEGEMLQLVKPMADISLKYNVIESYTTIRNVLECVFVDMAKRGLMTAEAVSKKDKTVILAWCSQILEGDFENRKDIQIELRDAYQKGKLECKLLGQLPKIMAQNIKTLYRTSCNNGHKYSLRDTVTRQYKLADYMDSVGGTPYLLRSFALQLCDFIIWYNNWLKNYDNE